MTILRVQCNIPRDNNIPADDAINVWHFLTVGAATPAAAANDAVTQLGVFYAALDVYFSTMVGTPMRFKVYNLADAEPRIPFLETTLTLTTGTGVAFPAEVAICLSYRAELISGANPARRRGRIYFGPLDADTATSGTGDMLVSSTVLNAFANAASDIIVAGATDDARWVVFSPTLAGPPPWDSPTLEAASADVTAGYIDNAFDTIRSRGAAATSRTVFSNVLP
jgi:hypothetical protein